MTTPAGESRGEVVLYEALDGNVRMDVRLENDTVWLTQQQMGALFGRERSVVTKHVGNVFREGELDEESNVQYLHFAGSDRPVGLYSLDVIVSVGYRVKSQRGTQFRIWATRVLREHLVRGYTVNQRRLDELRQAVQIVADTVDRRDLSGDEASALLRLVGEYGRALDLLDDYDHKRVEPAQTSRRPARMISHNEALSIVDQLRERFGASSLFGVEKDNALEGALAAVMQTFGGADVYPGIEDKAANLLYFLVKSHPFVDGNKRIAAALFLWFLEANAMLRTPAGQQRVSDATLVATTLLIAESKPAEKDVLVRIVTHLLTDPQAA